MGKPFSFLPPNLTQLVDDRLDEEQYEQAVELLDELCTQGVQPMHPQIRGLFALSLCSLAPSSMSSTSAWTIEQQHQVFVSRSLQQPARKGESMLQSVSRTHDRPSDPAILQAAYLLVNYAETSKVAGSIDVLQQADSNAALSRHVLSCLPSQRVPLSSTPYGDSKARKQPSKAQAHSEETTILARWIAERLLSAEDVWDLLAPGQFSSDTDSEPQYEFWMSEKDRKQYSRQIASKRSEHQELEDKLAQIRKTEFSAVSVNDSDEAESEDSLDSDSPSSLVLPKRAGSSKRSAPRATRDHKRPAAKKRFTERYAATEERQAKLTMSEGSWRTLSVLLHHWAHTAAFDTKEQIDSMLLWQFKSNIALPSNPSRRSAPRFRESIDQIDKALDIAMSFPRVLDAPKAAGRSTDDASNAVAPTHKKTTCGRQRLISKVAQAELKHRQKVTARLNERRCIERAHISAALLTQMYDLVILKQIQLAAFIEGCVERLRHLTTQEVKCLCAPLAARDPMLVAKLLSAYLQDYTVPHPDDLRAKKDYCLDFQHETLTMPSFFAGAVPERSTLHKSAQERGEQSDLHAVLAFLKRVPCSSELLPIYPLATFPTKTEYAAMISNGLQDRTALSKGQTVLLSGKGKQDMFKALAYTRVCHLEAHDRVNEIKFIIAKCLSRLVSQLSQDDTVGRIERAKSSDGWVPSSDGAVSASESNGGEIGPRTRVSKMLGQLVKAYIKDSADFSACLSAMRTHIGVTDLQAEEEQRLKDGEGLKQTDVVSPALPTLQVLVKRAQNVVRNAENLARACRILREGVVSSAAIVR